jgi:peptidoglycan/LPS O-acetylase OafA/YrhL
MSDSMRVSAAGRRTSQQDSATQVFRLEHLPELDGFRGLAVLVVVAGHYLQFRVPNPSPYFATYDKLGVLLFFVLSGFLITGLLHRERSVRGTINFRRFYMRRILRLAPALLLLLATVTALMRFGWITDVPRKEILECLFYARNLFGRSLSLGHIWSLSLEEQFYLIWPLAFTFLPLKRCATHITVICIVLAGWRGAAIVAHLFSYERGVFYMRPYFRFDSILIGACLVLWISTSSRAALVSGYFGSIVGTVAKAAVVDRDAVPDCGGLVLSDGEADPRFERPHRPHVALVLD